MRQSLILTLLFVLSALLGCTEKIVEDVNHRAEYKEFVGSRYEVIGTVVAYGIKMNLNQGVEYMTLIPPPGIAGPEVGFEVAIKVGSKIRILNVVKTNRWPDPNVTLIVQLDGTPMPSQKQIRIDLFRGNEGGGRELLNPKIYRKLEP
jgi:hypothetical protein